MLVDIDNPKEIAPILKAGVYEILEEIADKKFALSIGVEIEPILKKLKAIEKVDIPVC